MGMTDEITLDKEVFKALAGETRVQVLKALIERRKTQSELAKELNLAAPTIKDHVEILRHAGLVREMDDGHKWKYIELTVKGKSLLQPQDKRILVLLGTSLLGIVVSGFVIYSKWLSYMGETASAFARDATLKTAAVGNEVAVSASNTLQQGASVAPEAAARSAEVATQLFSSVIPLPELSVLVLCLVVFGVAMGMWIKQTY